VGLAATVDFGTRKSLLIVVSKFFRASAPLWYSGFIPKEYSSRKEAQHG